jgi:3-phosphoshikimate 1-carboxyvinyltransferase
VFNIPALDLPPLEQASGRVVLHGLLDSDDTRVMLAALQALGCTLQREANLLHVDGLGGQLRVKEAALFLGNAGTAMRPLTAGLALLAATQGGRFELSGVPRMHERPIGDLVDALRPLGCAIEDLGQPGYPPLRLSGPCMGRCACVAMSPANSSPPCCWHCLWWPTTARWWWKCWAS